MDLETLIAKLCFLRHKHGGNVPVTAIAPDGQDWREFDVITVSHDQATGSVGIELLEK